MRYVTRSGLGFIGGMIAIVGILFILFPYIQKAQQNPVLIYWIFGVIAVIAGFGAFIYGYKAR